MLVVLDSYPDFSFGFPYTFEIFFFLEVVHKFQSIQQLHSCGDIGYVNNSSGNIKYFHFLKVVFGYGLNNKKLVALRR